MLRFLRVWSLCFCVRHSQTPSDTLRLPHLGKFDSFQLAGQCLNFGSFSVRGSLESHTHHSKATLLERRRGTQRHGNNVKKELQNHQFYTNSHQYSTKYNTPVRQLSPQLKTTSLVPLHLQIRYLAGNAAIQLYALTNGWRN